MIDVGRTQIRNSFSSVSYKIAGKVVTIYRPKRGEYVDVSELLTEHCMRSGKYDFGFFDFNSIFRNTINSIVPKNMRMNTNTGKVKVLSFGEKGKQIDDLVRKVTDIAKEKPVEIIKRRKDIEYLEALKNICCLIYEDDWMEADETLAPLRGGALVAQFLPVDKDRIIPLDSKRLSLIGGDMGFGLGLPVIDDARRFDVRRIIEKRIRSLDGRSVQILEVAIGSGLTTTAFLLELLDRGVHPRHIEIVAPIVSQQGVDFTLRVAEDLGYNVSIKAGKMFYRVGDIWKTTDDSILDDDGNQVIGNAADILKNFLNIKEFTDRL